MSLCLKRKRTMFIIKPANNAQNQWSMNVRALATTLALFMVSVESKLYLVSTKNDSSVAEKGKY